MCRYPIRDYCSLLYQLIPVPPPPSDGNHMAAIADDERPVVVRVRRKASQYRLDALLLQINEGPFKREFLDFGKLSITDSSATDGLEINERSLKRALLDFGKLSISESSTSTVYGGSPNDDERPVVVGDKRKASQSRHDGLWIEISERPLKKTFFDLGKLSVSEASDSIVEELKTRKVLLCHVKTVTNLEVTFDVLQPEVPASADASKFKNKSKEIRHTFKAKDEHDRLLAEKAKQSQEFVSKNARFIQIWRSRKSKKEAMHEESLHDKCQFYDIVRVDFEETNQEMRNDHKRGSELDDHKLMSRYLPLLKEILPRAAMEIESNISISRLGVSPLLLSSPHSSLVQIPSLICHIIHPRTHR
ncbi:hypothetical protein Leryth_020861 [Lithospermum erythrorhizon]|nr:hypothetical protein Leryth_020861 [Lithospermum erythrorhizon]